ncbi:MAG: TPR end-of-group domain-containing protein, partial [Planctomycetota bacterium]
CLGVTPILLAQPVFSVRNFEPVQSVSKTSETWRIYYPRLAHLAGARGANKDDDLARTLLDLHTAMRYEEASSVAVQIIELDQSRPEGHYNLACVLARLHRTDEAVAALDRAVALGWRDRTHMILDPDLEVIRSDVRFGELLHRLHAIVAQEQGSNAVPGDARSGEPAEPAHTEDARPIEAADVPVPQHQPTPVFVLVSEPPEVTDHRAHPDATRLVTLALSPAIAQRLRDWLAARRPQPEPLEGWITLEAPQEAAPADADHG